MIYDLILTGLLQGLVLSLVAYAVMIPFKLLNCPDLTSEASYPFGGAICSALIVFNVNCIYSTIIAVILSGIIGIGTAFIYLRFKINSLLAGIIISTMIYSINLRVMGKPNIALFNEDLLFSNIDILSKIMIISSIVLFLALALFIFLYTEKGLRFRAVGLNVDFAKKQKISIKQYTSLGLFIANCYAGLAGALMVQIQSYMDINIGVGIVIHGLASLMIGEAIVGANNLKKQLLAPLIGALTYQQIQGLALFIGLAPSDLKFLTASIVLLVLYMHKNENRG